MGLRKRVRELERENSYNTFRVFNGTSYRNFTIYEVVTAILDHFELTIENAPAKVQLVKKKKK